MNPSATAYDDSFRTLLNDCTELVIPVVNEAFGEDYTGTEEIIFSPNEHFLNQDGGNEEKRVTDAAFSLVRADGARKRYHIECEANLDDTIIVRMFEYDAQIALDDGKMAGHTFTVSFPHSAVLALRHTEKTPDTMHIRVVTPGGGTGYDVPVVKVQQYSLEEIFRKKLLFFLPYYIFCHEKELAACEDDGEKLKLLTDEYRHIRERLDGLQEAGELSSFTKNAICAMITHVLELIAEKYQNVREGVEHIMGGKVVEYEAKTIYNEGISIGLDRGRDEGINIGIDRGRDEERKLAVAENEERARDMIRDRMELPLVEKYTHLSMPRIRELARGLGML